MKSMDDESIDLVFTSPPYNLGKMKKGGYYQGKERVLNYGVYDDDQEFEKYVSWQRTVLKELYRLIKDTGAIFYNHKHRIQEGILDDRKNLIPFPLRQEIVWNRCGMINFSGSFYANNTERIYIIAKDGWRPNKGYVGFGEVWTVPAEMHTLHPAPFPKKLAEMAISSASPVGGVVLDPFAGSGTTLLVAEESGRNSIGIEIDPGYVKMIEGRLSEIQPKLIY